MWWKFYLIPDYVSIRRDINGHPVFLLIKYAFNDQDRQENKNLPRGGGFMVFDVELSVREADYPKIIAELQQSVNSQWQQLKALADAAGNDVRGYSVNSWHYLNGNFQFSTLSVNDLQLGLHPERPEAPPGDAPPKVIISQPTWKEGKFHVSAPQSTDLVAHRVSEGPVSLVGNNVVSANMDLTTGGATFMEKTLTNLDGSGATDLTPIQVVYELTFWARVPPVHLLVTVDSRSLYEATKNIYHDYEGNGCDEDSINHSEQNLEMAVQSGLINIQIDTGTLSLSDDFVQQLRSGALKFVQDQIKDNFFDKKQAPPPADDPTKDFVGSDKEIYYLKSDIDFKSVSIGYNEQIDSIVEWKANPQGTLQTFLAGVSPSEMKRYVRDVDLRDTFFMTLGLTTTVFADWEHEPIAFVECQISYTGRDENNQLIEKVQTFTFAKDHTAEFWDPSLIGSKREYEYRWRVGFFGHDAGEFTSWLTETTPKLNISIADPGKITIKVLAGNIDFAQTTKQVQVDLKYGGPGLEVPEEGTTLVLVNGQLEGNYERYIYSTWDHPVLYHARFYLKNEQVVESDWQETVSRQLLINQPFLDQLKVQLVPAGSWDGVVQTVVNLRYKDELHSYHSEEAYTIKSADEFKTWAIVLRDPNQRKFQYKILSTFKDGSTPAQTDWIDADGDQAVLIRVQQHPELKVKLLAGQIDFKVTPVVECTLHYDDLQGHIQKVDTFPFSKAEDAVWDFPLASDSRRTYRYQITYHTADGHTIPMPEVSTDTTSVVIPPLEIPVISCTIFPKLVNFVQTPVVEVDFEYKDPDHHIEFEDTAVFTDSNPQSFRVQVDKASPRNYNLAVTYYTADGKVIQRDPVTLDKNKVVIPMYVATS